MNDVNLIRSGTWFTQSVTIDDLNEILNETVQDFVDDDEHVVNVQCKEENGQGRFWIYTSKNKQ